MTERLAQISQLLAPVIVVSGARALGGSTRAGIIILIIVIPDDLVVCVCLIGGEAGLVRG
jgi:hypothetical protein